MSARARASIVATLVALACAMGCSSAPPPARKVFILGVDGLDPKLLQQFMDQGALPNIQKLVARGQFKPLMSTMPPLSPVAWATFITGMDAGGHGVFDFIQRDSTEMAPMRGETEVTPPHNVPLGGCVVLPIGGGPKNRRQGAAFWQLLEQHGVPSTLYHMPDNFPPVPSKGHALSGMGTPDARGTSGTFQFYSDVPVRFEEQFRNGDVYRVRVTDGHVAAKLTGPADPFRNPDQPNCARNLEVPFDVYLDPGQPAAKLKIQDTEFVLRQGEWSDWVRIEFKALPMFASVTTIARFYLKSVRPDFQLYVTPLQINPAEPGAMPLSTPAGWSRELCDDLGYYYTQELPDGNNALSTGVLNAHEYWEHSQFVFQEQRRAFERLITNYKSGLLFVYFSSVDQASHMLWNYMDKNHPGYIADSTLAGGIETLYREIDGVVGRAMELLPEDATFVVMSDHGFEPFYWKVNLNSWLVEKGYATLTYPDRRDFKWFMNVDWKRTQAYAVGLNGVYLNVQGREKFGSVAPAERERVVRQLERDLLDMVDPRNGQHPISLVIDPRRDLHGAMAGSGPDLIVGYSRGYRSSWENPLGEYPKDVFIDNVAAWSGDHSGDYRVVPGVLIANRPITLEQPALYDVTVAILDEYGVAKTRDMIGRDCLGPR